MIEITNAIEVFQQNIGRTKALIEAMDKIKAYNCLYQMREAVTDPQIAKLVTEIQDRQLAWIELSCAEHAIISLATAFETYCKELVQELLASYPDYFLRYKTNDTNQVRKLIESKEKISLEKIEATLKFKNRFDYYRFFESYSIPFLSEKEAELIEYIFIKRNYFVHNAGKPNGKTEVKLQQIPHPVKEEMIRTEAKKLRTKLERVIISLHKRVHSVCK